MKSFMECDTESAQSGYQQCHSSHRKFKKKGAFEHRPSGVVNINSFLPSNGLKIIQIIHRII